MKRKLGTVLMIFGAVLVILALSLFLSNQREQTQAQESVARVLPQLREQIREHLSTKSASDSDAAVEIPQELLTPQDLEMTEVEIGGYGYIGFLSIPALNLELPVMSGWDETRLKIAPCRYSGTLRGEDLVIMAHNYTTHFGRLRSLSEGDSVAFTDMAGNVTQFQVVGVDILAATAVEEMTAGDFDLTLFTCTYNGQNRVAVYCDRVKTG